MRGGALRSLREQNRVRVVRALRREGTASRAEISRMTGLSRATVSSLVSGLMTEGIVVERPMASGPTVAGRPPTLLALAPAAGAALGVDFGHRHVRVAVADLSSRVLAERHRSLDVDGSATEALDAAAELAEAVLAETGTARERVIGCGMGIPGPIDRETGAVQSSSILPGWTGVRPAEELGGRIGVRVDTDNDANLGVLGEATYGAASGMADVVYVKISSGIGAGLLLGGRLYRGSSGIAGEVGHVLVDPNGRLCRCGSRGCLETVAAAPALLELLRETHDEELTTVDVVDMANRGDVGTWRLVADAGRAVGRVLADVCNLLNPQLLVLGGDLAAAEEPLLEGVRESLARYALPRAADAVRVAAGVLGDRAELLGALALVITEVEDVALGGLAELGTSTAASQAASSNPR